MLSNTSAYPESADYPNDGNGGDHDSLSGCSRCARSPGGERRRTHGRHLSSSERSTADRTANYPSPRGLLDIPGWQQMGKGEGAQAVEVSAYPQVQQLRAGRVTILSTLTARAARSTQHRSYPVVILARSRVIARGVPLPEGTWVSHVSSGAHSPDHRGAVLPHRFSTSPRRRYADPRRRLRHGDRCRVLRRVRRPRRDRAPHRRAQPWPPLRAQWQHGITSRSAIACARQHIADVGSWA